MDRMEAGIQISELFLRLVNKYNALEKVPEKHGFRTGLYHSERHLLDQIGNRPEWNITEHAAAAGVTKGAVSQTVDKLEAKGLVLRRRKGGNGKSVFLELTKRGTLVVEKRRSRNEEVLRPFCSELGKHPDDRIEFLVGVFQWLDRYLEDSGRKMKDKQGG